MKNLIFLFISILAFFSQNSKAQNTIIPNEAETIEKVHGPLAASYDYQIYCMTAIFTNTSLNAIGFIWAFGNGDTIITQHPTYVYEEPGEYAVALTAINTNGGTVTFIDTVTVDFCASTHSAIPKQSLLAYPNPASQSINFSLPISNQAYSLIVYDSKGKQVFEKEITQSNENIAIENWKTGLYVYAILDKKLNIINSNKFLIKR